MNCLIKYFLGSDFNIPIIILWQLVAGKRFSENSKEGNELMDKIKKNYLIWTVYDHHLGQALANFWASSWQIIHN